jgi:hypothetical protein
MPTSYNTQSEYNQEHFQQDLSQLKTLIANYKSGGKSGNRFYTISKVDGKIIESGQGGRYTVKPGQSPGDAAKRAFTQIRRRFGQKDKIVTLRETTQGSAKKEYSYSCKSIKLKEPRMGPIDKKTGKQIMFEHESHCTKIKTSTSSKGGFYI